MTSSFSRAQVRRAALRRRLAARHPLFAEQLYAREVAQFRAYYAGQSVPAPTHPRRQRPTCRPVNQAAQKAFNARQLDLFGWRPRKRGVVQAVVGVVQRLLRRGMRGIVLKLFPSRQQGGGDGDRRYFRRRGRR